MGEIVNRPRGKRLRLRFDATCISCQTSLPAGSYGWWNATEKSMTCELCAAPNQAWGTAGASAQQVADKRRAKREKTVTARHPRLGKIILAVSKEPQSTTAWATGAAGEQKLGGGLDKLRSDATIVMHDRKIPGSKANIDHIAVAPSGIYVIDAKKYTGEVRCKDVGGLFSTDRRLFVGRRDCTKLVGAMERQVQTVCMAITPETPAVIPVLCFVDADWSMLTRPFTLGDVVILWPRALMKRLQQPGPLDADAVQRLGRSIAIQLPGHT